MLYFDLLTQFVMDVLPVLRLEQLVTGYASWFVPNFRIEALGTHAIVDVHFLIVAVHMLRTPVCLLIDVTSLSLAPILAHTASHCTITMDTASVRLLMFQIQLH